MITIPEIRVGPLVSRYVNDEIHIVGKGSKHPSAVLSFIAIDEFGETISEAPVVTVSLSGAGYTLWYQSWDGETTLYSKLFELLAVGQTGVKIAGADFSRIGGIDKMILPATAEEVLN